MWGSRERTIYGVVFCQFIAAFSALGMPPFFSLMLQRSLSHQNNSFQTSLAGFFYVVPTLFAAISSPFWGMLADRFSKKSLLIRAQLGLTLSFLAAGFSNSTEQFFLALVIQGIFGGTFAASRAYIATLTEGDQLAHSLTLMEAAPRAALVISPLIMGYLLGNFLSESFSPISSFLTLKSPVEIYRYLALLPLLATLFTLKIPDVTSSTAQFAPIKSERNLPKIANPVSFFDLLMIQLLFGIAAVLTSPYFVHSIKNRFSSLSPSQIGMIFGLPHLVYLAAAGPLSLKIKKVRFYEVLIASFILQSITLLGQSFSQSVASLIAWRTLMGISMTVSFICIHGLISQVNRPERAGGLFGWLESCVKMSTVIGGVIASFSYKYSGPNSHFSISAGIFSCAAILLTYRNRFISKEKPA